MTITTRDLVRCRAHNNRGLPCSAYPIRGAVVCVVHGGSAPQVKKAAADRLAEMVDPILSEMSRMALKGESEAIRVAAGKDLLDRAGVGKDKALIGTAVAFTLRIDRGDSDD